MLKLAHFLTIAFLLHVTSVLAEPAIKPRLIQLEYQVTRDGKPFATVKEQFSQDGKQYKIESVTKGIGVYALFGERKLSSVGEVTAEGLKPTRFELRQGDSERKTLISDFDWSKNTLNMQVKGKLKTAVLAQGAQDLASYAYQFMFAPPAGEIIKVALTTGKKFNHYEYQVAARRLPLEAANTKLNTLHMVSTGADKRQLWLAEDQHYLVARYSQIDENGAVLEQTLTKIHVE